MVMPMTKKSPVDMIAALEDAVKAAVSRNLEDAAGTAEYALKFKKAADRAVKRARDRAATAALKIDQWNSMKSGPNADSAYEAAVKAYEAASLSADKVSDAVAKAARWAYMADCAAKKAAWAQYKESDEAAQNAGREAGRVARDAIWDILTSEQMRALEALEEALDEETFTHFAALKDA